MTAGRQMPALDHAGVCEFHQAAARGARQWQEEILPSLDVVDDLVDSCVTNHRIVREHAGGSLRRSWHAAGQGARPSPDGPAPRPEAKKFG
jgi:hypothetical protein